MDPAADPNQLDQTYRLLALCARAEGHAAFYQRLGTQLNAFSAWDLLPAQAELHGMGALLWHHLRQARLPIPAETEQTLTGLYLRQRALNRLHTEVLLDVYAHLEWQGIVPILLKGLALAHQYYPDPALRAVSDIDLLLPSVEISPAAAILLGAGFTASDPAVDLAASPPAEVRLLAPARQGTRTLVELHHAHVGPWPMSGPFRDAELAGLDAAPQTLEIGGRRVRLPAPADTLNYLSRHFQRHLFEASSNRPLPLKWVADILSLVERHAPEPGWTDHLRRDPALMQRLEVFYSLTPHPQRLDGIIPVRGAAPPAGLNRYPGGWPREHYRPHPQERRLRFVMRTFAAPSPWWLRLHYGISQQSCWCYGAVVHPLFVLRLASRGLIRRILRGLRRLPQGARGRDQESR
jgi:hypothetical protein